MNLIDRLFGRARIRIEAVSTRHAASIAALHGGSFAQGWSQPDLARMLSEGGILADGVFIEDSPEPCGFVLSRLAADEAEILTICLDPAMRGRGLGRLLLERHMHELARRGVGRLFLEVDEKNASALALYRRHGFRQVGERPGYYAMPDGDRALALILRRDLT